MSKTYRYGNILNKMGTTSFWSNDVFDGLAYMTSAAITGGTLGGAAIIASDVRVKENIKY
jgi:hypothetical protein